MWPRYTLVSSAMRLTRPSIRRLSSIANHDSYFISYMNNKVNSIKKALDDSVPLCGPAPLRKLQEATRVKVHASLRRQTSKANALFSRLRAYRRLLRPRVNRNACSLCG
ncbi:Geranylgeranyl pyrophosphate synthase 6 [Cardamine amara subsp. amara]|uniref:Geranylgeranyl pyrophosphate synthase 6 n=1 Tax=Cardamine amara subsp. amara TaxID=228776 RepID=A0ABD0Z1X7_CARAN